MREKRNPASLVTHHGGANSLPDRKLLFILDSGFMIYQARHGGVPISSSEWPHMTRGRA